MIKICQLGCGLRPLTKQTISSFRGLENIKHFEIINVDIRKYPLVDIQQDLSKPHWDKLPRNVYDIVIAEHIAEHMPNRLNFLEECLRILKSDGTLIIEVPNWKHDSAHNTLEHYTTWGRCIFDDGYISEGKFKLIKMEFRLTIPFTWKWNFYITNQFIGRQLDKYTRKISGLRFYIRKLKNVY